VKILPGTDQSEIDIFPSTHWSVVRAAGASEVPPEVAKTALTLLCQTYWAPLYTFVRGRGHNVHDAQDLTQSFFAHLIEHEIYVGADPKEGKFRSFLLASLKNFLADAYDRERALKRGGGTDFLPLKEEQADAAESLFQTHVDFRDEIGEDQLFERGWAEALVTAGLKRVWETYKSEGKEKLFQELKVYLTGSSDPLPAYEQLAARLGLVASTLRSHVTRLRARYREALRAEVRRTVISEAQVDEELRELLRVLTHR
jgi:RNA polymerase sigma-70 factor (ECF subfamily)